MLLKDYYSNLNKQFTKFKFKGIAFDSAMVKKNYIFFAIKGGSHRIVSVSTSSE